MYVKAGRREEAERLLDVNDLPHRQAVVFAALGDKARTLEALNRAAVTVPQRTVIMLVYPEMAFLRGDPGQRFCERSSIFSSAVIRRR
jgi:hypothetical protein